MGMCTSGDILQATLDELLGYIEGIKTYIDDILVLRKESLYNHIEQPMIIFGRFRDAGLKVNTTK